MLTEAIQIYQELGLPGEIAARELAVQLRMPIIFGCRRESHIGLDLLPSIGSRVARNIARLLLAERRRMEPDATQGSPSPAGAHSRTAVLLQVVCNWDQIGVNACTLCFRVRGSKPHEFRLPGQVGQESHRHPAVLEHAAQCPE